MLVIGVVVITLVMPTTDYQRYLSVVHKVECVMLGKPAHCWGQCDEDHTKRY